MTPLDLPKLTGNRCQCAACGELFNGLAGFDLHRIGPHNGLRTCLPVTAMIANGFDKNAAGFWVTDSGAQRIAKQSAAALERSRSSYPSPSIRQMPADAIDRVADHGCR